MADNLRIDQFAPSPGIDGTAIFAGVQIISAISKDAKFTPNQLLAYISSNLPQTYPTRVEYSNLFGQTTSLNPVGSSYLVPVNSVYQIAANVNLTSGTGTVAIECHFTDVHSTAQVQNLVSITGTGFATSSTYLITAFALSQISFKATLTGVATYDVSTILIRVS